MEDSNKTNDILGFIENQFQPTIETPLTLYQAIIESDMMRKIETEIRVRLSKSKEMDNRENNGDLEFEDDFDVMTLLDEILYEIKRLTFKKLVDGVNNEFLGRGFQAHTFFCLNEISSLIEKTKTGKPFIGQEYVRLDLVDIKDYIKDKLKNKSRSWFVKMDDESRRNILNSKKYFQINESLKFNSNDFFREFGRALEAKLFLNSEDVLVNIFVKNIYHDEKIKLKSYKGRTNRRSMMYILFKLMKKNILDDFWEDKTKVIQSAITIFETNPARNEEDSMRKAYIDIDTETSSKLFTLENNKEIKLISDTLDHIINKLSVLQK